MSRFANLPKPDIIEDLSYEQLLAAMLDTVRSGFLESGVNYDVGNLEFDPAKIQTEAGTFRELLVRARGNDIAWNNLIAFSTGSTLDHLAAFHDVTRLADEDDDRLRGRVALAISGRSTAGGVDWYKSAAMRASVQVRDVAVYRTGIGPELEIAVLSDLAGGWTYPAILNLVNEEVQKDSVRVVSDVITVVQAVSTHVNIEAEIWLLPTASQNLMNSLPILLTRAWDREGGLGFDLKRSWITSKLHYPGVARVNLISPTTDRVVGNNDAVRIANVNLTYMGRDR